MKTQRYAALALLAALLAAASLTAFAQAERVKGKAKDLKKQVEAPNAKTNAPPPRPAQ